MGGHIHDSRLGVIVIFMSLRCHVMTCYSPQSVGKHKAVYQMTLTGVCQGVMRVIADLLESGCCASKNQAVTRRIPGLRPFWETNECVPLMLFPTKSA